jgi:hypothetical protein
MIRQFYCRFWEFLRSIRALFARYEDRVSTFKTRYAKSNEWEAWMLDNRSRYELAFRKAEAAPGVLGIAFRYYANPIAYNPPWSSEAQHMTALETFAEATYAGYDFRFIFHGDTVCSYANVIAGIPTNDSQAFGKDIYLYYEAIFHHEFAHVMGLPHHYDREGEYGRGSHMPPGESYCLMDRSSPQLCSACRTALGIPLDIDNELAINAAWLEIARRYPY